MTFIISKNSPNTRVKIANKDIECYKTLELSYKGNIVSLYSYDVYFNKGESKDFVLKEIKQLYVNKRDNSIENGLSSCSVYRRAQYYKSKAYIKERFIYAGIIPKGSRYYYNPDTEEYVSDKLIVFNNIIG